MQADESSRVRHGAVRRFALDCPVSILRWLRLVHSLSLPSDIWVDNDAA